MTEKIEGTDENWETRVLGADEQFVRQVDATEVDEGLGLVTITLRMRAEEVDQLTALALERQIILPAFIRTILQEFIAMT